MAVNVRVFGYTGIAALPITFQTQDHKDGVYVLPQPYVWCQTLLNVGATPVTATFAAATRKNPAGAADTTAFLRIEVQDGGTIRYEVTPTGTAVAADVNSPSLSGKDQIQFGSGWSISVIDASTVSG